MIVLAGMMAGAAAQASAAGASTAPGTSRKRQISECMSKQMSASRTLSYNEASKICKAQLKSQSPTLANGAAKPGTSR